MNSLIRLGLRIASLPILDVKKRYPLMRKVQEAISKEEVELASQNGFKVVSLGKRILRAETAALYGLSVIGYLKEKNHG